MYIFFPYATDSKTSEKSTKEIGTHLLVNELSSTSTNNKVVTTDAGTSHGKTQPLPKGSIQQVKVIGLPVNIHYNNIVVIVHII